MLRVLALLIATLACQAANADVKQINRGGPTCDPTFKACILVIQIGGEIRRHRCRLRKHHFTSPQHCRGEPIHVHVSIG